MCPILSPVAETLVTIAGSPIILDFPVDGSVIQNGRTPADDRHEVSAFVGVARIVGSKWLPSSRVVEDLAVDVSAPPYGADEEHGLKERDEVCDRCVEDGFACEKLHFSAYEIWASELDTHVRGCAMDVCDVGGCPEIEVSSVRCRSLHGDDAFLHHEGYGVCGADSRSIVEAGQRNVDGCAGREKCCPLPRLCSFERVPRRRDGVRVQWVDGDSEFFETDVRESGSAAADAGGCLSLVKDRARLRSPGKGCGYGTCDARFPDGFGSESHCSGDVEAGDELRSRGPYGGFPSERALSYACDGGHGGSGLRSQALRAPRLVESAEDVDLVGREVPDADDEGLLCACYACRIGWRCGGCGFW